jgi:hypothetical protein
MTGSQCSGTRRVWAMKPSMSGQDQGVVLTSSLAVTGHGVAMRVADRNPRTPIAISHASSTDISAMLTGRVPFGSEKIRLTSNAAPAASLKDHPF